MNIPERVLTFALDGEIFAIDAQAVREILEVPTITRVPGAPDFASGLINVRGAIVPLTDLAVAFGMARADHGEDTRVIVIEAEVEGEPTTIGLVADKVLDVAAMEGVAVEEAPPVGMRWRADFIRAIARPQGQFVILPDLELIFAESLATAARLHNLN
ncbi:chemotaxis protein CheW [Novosphingobium humi]|uniref:Chemotaxis protein CheW n=1 Tax=Novosphingobium humi TaxID=2282397 RepID=A0ABY7U1W6_9SPHN|nr:chemotaxis protein CheW [Novosphingobium humi]WCT78329.1 chemotaxis protein CheW [Novosphingobium humi]